MSQIKIMKNVVALALLYLAPYCLNAGEIYIPIWEEEIYGTWINPEYPMHSSAQPQKWTFYNWGIFEVFYRIDDEKPFEKGTVLILSKWKEKDGSVWYKTFERIEGLTTAFLYLYRISENGETIECVSSRYYSAESIVLLTADKLDSKTNVLYNIWRRKH